MTNSYPTRWLHFAFLIIASSSLNVHAKNKYSIPPPITYENVSYGNHSNQIFDFWKSDVEGAAPLVIYIHGGGFTSGSHDKVYGDKVQQFLKGGVHHASIEYRFRQHAELPAAHEDVIRALQFIRNKADEWGIDKDRIAAYGGSAGGQLVSYLAWHDDFADAQSDDPIARESSRLTAVAPRGVQSTMDKEWWVENIPGYKKSFYKAPDLSKPVVRDLIKELSIITHISADDPPTFMSYGMNPDTPIPRNKKSVKGWATHHVNFGIALKEQLKRNSVEVHLMYPKNQTNFKDDVAFLLHHLKAASDE
ncbi:alpha/beta hydrolase [Thalassotalea psychrophila]|uniref:Alpha/beta hydrolase n=1 Tax=Thalassotalea psychrophila TaxID=3065647 RepID=A0ABY9TW13_9GAMM|nr:alpha/beta hydrolase [Colwelliaceae bacterium SQ149]